MGIFGRDTRRPQHEGLETVLGPSASLTGHLRSDGGARIDGTFEGVIEVAGNVVVGESGRVAASITARNVTVGGAVKGDIDATGRLEILATGQVHGDIMVAQVMIDEGGVFQGLSRMRGMEQRALAAPADDADPRADEAEITPPKEKMVEASARPLPEQDESQPAAGRQEDDFEPIIPDVVIEDIPEDTDEAAGSSKPPPRKRASPRRSRR